MSLMKEYQPIKQIGKGRFGTVYLARSPQNEQVALKLSRDEPRSRQEFAILKRIVDCLPHVPVPRPLALFPGDDGQLVLAMSWIEGQCFPQAVVTLPSLLALFEVCGQLLQVVAALHEQQIAHRDLHDQNILVSSTRQVSLIDFGNALHAASPKDLRQDCLDLVSLFAIVGWTQVLTHSRPFFHTLASWCNQMVAQLDHEEITTAGDLFTSWRAAMSAGIEREHAQELVLQRDHSVRLEAIQIGARLHPEISVWEEGDLYSIHEGVHLLRVFIRHPSPRDVASITHGPIKVGVMYEGGTMLLLATFAEQVECFCPYHWYLAGKPEGASRSDYLPVHLHVVLIDAATGMVLALRRVQLSMQMTHTLSKCIAAQRAQKQSPNPEMFRAHVQHLLRYPAIWSHCLTQETYAAQTKTP